MNTHDKTITIAKRTYLDPRSKEAINLARSQGLAIDTQLKYGGGTNRQRKNINIPKLESDDNDIIKYDHVPFAVSKLIQMGRQSKGLTQKDLAQKIFEKQSVIKEYESGTAIMNEKILMKIERVIEIKLRGKERGQPLILRGKK